MEREACVCDHGFERSDSYVEIIIIIIIITGATGYIQIKPRNGGPNDQKHPYNDHPKFNFPRRKFASAKVFIYIDTTLCTTFSILGTSQFVPLGGYIHNGIYYTECVVVFLYISVGRGKVEKYRYLVFWDICYSHSCTKQNGGKAIHLSCGLGYERRRKPNRALIAGNSMFVRWTLGFEMDSQCCIGTRSE